MSGGRLERSAGAGCVGCFRPGEGFRCHYQLDRKLLEGFITRDVA